MSVTVEEAEQHLRECSAFAYQHVMDLGGPEEMVDARSIEEWWLSKAAQWLDDAISRIHCIPSRDAETQVIDALTCVRQAQRTRPPIRRLMDVWAGDVLPDPMGQDPSPTHKRSARLLRDIDEIVEYAHIDGEMVDVTELERWLRYIGVERVQRHKDAAWVAHPGSPPEGWVDDDPGTPDIPQADDESDVIDDFMTWVESLKP